MFHNIYVGIASIMQPKTIPATKAKNSIYFIFNLYI